MGKKKAEDEENEKPGNEPEVKKPEPEEEPLLVKVDEDEDEEAGEEVTSAERPSRQQKKANRYREAQEAAEAAQRRADALETELARARALIQAPPQGNGQQKDEISEALDKNWKAQSEISHTFEALSAAKRLPPEEHQRLLDRARDLQDERAELLHRRVAAKHAPPQVDPMVAHFQASAADVFAHPKASVWAKAKYQMALATEGGRITPERDLEIAMASADEARKQFRLGQYRGGVPAPDSQRRKYEGPSRSAPARGEDRPSREIDMSNPTYRKMANKAFDHIKDEKKRMQMWARTAGKAMLDNEAKSS